MPIILNRVLAAFLLVCFVFSASAQAEVDQALQSYFVKKIGPWYIHKSAWANGDKGCTANNFHAGEQLPVFGLYAINSKGKVHSQVRFDTRSNAKANALARVIIGGSELRFQHPAGYEHGGYFPRNSKQKADTLSRLVALQQSAGSRKSFSVITPDGRKFQFDARKTIEVLDYLTRNCGFNVKISKVKLTPQSPTTRVQPANPNVPTQTTGQPSPSGSKSYGLLVKQIPNGTKVKYQTSEGKTYTMEFMGGGGNTYRVRFSGVKNWMAQYDAQGRLKQKNFPKYYNVKASFKPYECSFALGNCKFNRINSYKAGPESKLEGAYQTNLVKQGKWFHLSVRRGQKPVAEKISYRLTKHNLVAEFRSGNYWEKLVSISN
jgi:hypothetical protein